MGDTELGGEGGGGVGELDGRQELVSVRGHCAQPSGDHLQSPNIIIIYSVSTSVKGDG